MALDPVCGMAVEPVEGTLRLAHGGQVYYDTEVQAQDPLAVTLADLAHAGLAAHHTPQPFTSAEAGQLLERVLDG